MRMFEAVPEIIRDLLDESKVITTKEHSTFKVSATRHPTLGKMVIVESKEGDGIIVETEE